ncbi:hypothetical protein [Mucilaginibacter pedocola]|uniref:Uncharacterized protein n=1 Tax=Mucilaginibacter pedocola TaxID=1792845 RepID=A0A1S9PL83_9SPHI|nr:hypothetical protein [Mucilaginibacter pedocola]OOQ61694.1 hypothetical protein BC343_01065 [Mucilaginibacter pedocola]
MTLIEQIAWLFLLPLPVACIAWTVTHEEVFREVREYCSNKCKTCKTMVQRKFFYLFTCEYCFSHYVTLLVLFITRFKLLLPDWRGYVLAGFSMIWIANFYMSYFALLRQKIKLEKAEAEKVVKEIEED